MLDKLDKAKREADKPLNEGMLLGLVRKKYPQTEYAVLDQVKSDTSNRARVADAIALGLWTSRDLGIEGFEFKVSRSSWLQELKTPQKAEEIARFCDRWWLVAPSEEIIKVDELPPNWGLYIPDKNGGLKVRVQAPILTPKDPDRIFLGCLMRRLLDQKICEDRGEALLKEYERGKLEGKAVGLNLGNEGKDSRIEWLHRELYNKTAQLAFVQEVFGQTKLDSKETQMWGEIVKEITGHYQFGRNPDNIRPLLEAVRFVKDAPIETLEKRFLSMKMHADDLSAWITSKLEAMNLLKKEPTTP